jgi:signal transduction histidine kinase
VTLAATQPASVKRRAQALIIDDNVELAENLADILLGVDGFELDVHLAGSGQAARSFSEKLGDELDVALVDLRLPDANGLRLLTDLRRHATSAEFLVVTGDLSIESAVAAVGARVFAYVLKPFRPQELQGTLRNALEQVALRRSAERLRRELEQSEQRHREVVEVIPAFVLVLDQDHRITLWNPRLEATTGFSKQEMLGKSGADLVGDGGDRRLDLKDGGHRLVRWQCTELRNRDGMRVTYALGIDVTEEREMLRRTLQVERLATAGTLATGLAHEIRNPLNSANLQLQVLKRRIEKGQTEQELLIPVIGLIHDEIERLTHLVSEFLAFARPHRLAIERIALNDLIRGVIELVGPEASAVSVRIETNLDASVGMLDVEPNRIRQVLMNLVRNALEAMAGGGTLKIRTLPADTEGFVHIEVEDTGPGFPEDAPLFDAFYTTKPGGTGLGLAITHRIVSEHGGLIRAVPRSPGALFSIALPQHSKARV